MSKIVDTGPRVVELTPDAGLSAQQLRVELAACRAQLEDCRTVLEIPQILHEVARLIAAEPLATWMEHVVTILAALDESAATDPAFVLELFRLVEVVEARVQGGMWIN